MSFHNSTLLHDIASLDKDKDIFIKIIDFLKYKEYTNDEILEIICVSKHTLKKYMYKPPKNSKMETYKIPLHIKKILSFYLRLPINTWKDDINSKNISYYSPIEEKEHIQNKFEMKNMSELLINRVLYVYHFNEDKKTVFEDTLRIQRNMTFKYTHIEDGKPFEYYGNVFIQFGELLLYCQDFNLTMDMATLNNYKGNIQAILTVRSDKSNTILAYRTLLAKNQLSEETIKSFIGTSSNSILNVILS